MNKNKIAGLVAAALVAGLAIGSIGIASAASTAKTSSTSTTSAAAGVDHDGDGHGPDGAGHPRGLEGRGAGDIAEALAGLSDLTVADIRTQREAGKSYASIAKAAGVSTDELVAATTKIETAELDADVKVGTITSAQRTQVLSGLKTFLTAEIASTDAMRGGHEGPGRHGGRGGFGGIGDIAEAIANLTDLEVSDVQTQHEAGKSYASIAKAAGVSTDKVIAETTKIETAELDAAVKAGTMTAAERTQILSGMKANLEQAMTDTQTGRGPDAR